MAEKHIEWSRQKGITPYTAAYRQTPPGEQIREHWWSRARATEAVVLAGDRQHNRLIAEYEQRGVRTRDAVIALTTKGAMLGTPPDTETGHLFGVDYEENGEKWATLAIRLGAVPVDVAIGLLVPDEERWHGVEKMTIADVSVPVDELAERYPHTPLIDLPGRS